MNLQPHSSDDGEPEGLPCQDKLAFDTQREAEGSANVVQYRYGNKMHVYRCTHCNLWHLASGSAD